MQDVFQECYLELHSAKSPGKVHTSDARPTCSKMGKHQRAFFRFEFGILYMAPAERVSSCKEQCFVFRPSLFVLSIGPLESVDPLKLALSCFCSILKNEKYEGRVRHLLF